MAAQRANAVSQLSFNRGTLLLRGVRAEEVDNYFPRGIWTWDERVGAWRADALHYEAARDALNRRFGSACQDEVSQPPPVHWPGIARPPLRPEQVEALAAWRAAGHFARGSKRGERQAGRRLRWTSLRDAL